MRAEPKQACSCRRHHPTLSYLRVNSSNSFLSHLKQNKTVCCGQKKKGGDAILFGRFTIIFFLIYRIHIMIRRSWTRGLFTI